MYLSRSLIHLALLFSMVAVALGTEPGGPPGSLDPARGYVFSGASAKVLAEHMISREDLGPTWDPGNDDITRMENALAQELSHRLGEHQATEHRGPDVRDYYRQYAGVHHKGQKLILINGFHGSHVESTTAWLAQPHSESELQYFPAGARGKDWWHFVPVQVLDGGEYYFEAYYDPVHGRIVGFQFHGYA
jgi:hypothetical protein